jgi:hypothetical protein
VLELRPETEIACVLLSIEMLLGTAAPRRCLRFPRFRRIRGDIEFAVAEAAAAATARLLRHSINHKVRAEERHSHP